MKKLLSIAVTLFMMGFVSGMVEHSIAYNYNIVQLTDNSYSDVNPRINNNGQVVWWGYYGTDNEIFLNDGTNTIQLTNNSYQENNFQINASG